MLIKLSTDKTIAETAAALQAAVEVNRIGAMPVHNPGESMKKRAWLEYGWIMCTNPPVPVPGRVPPPRCRILSLVIGVTRFAGTAWGPGRIGSDSMAGCNWVPIPWAT